MISIVLPVFNEQEVLSHMFSRLKDVIESINLPVEIIFVNDGSTDKSMDILLDLIKKDKNIRILEFSRNFGHQAAIMAGLEYANGDAVIMMDADLQHPPELIPDLISKWKEGYDVVYTFRTNTKDATVFKRLTSIFFYKIINYLSNIEVPSGAADFRLMDRRVIDSFRSLSEKRLFLRGLVSWIGYRQIGIPYEAEPRDAGKSKYSLYRMLKFAADGITAFSSIPLYISALIGIFISGLGFIYALFVIYSWLFTNRVVEGWTSLMVVVLFIGGIQLISMGIIGVYLGRIYDEAKQRPRYLIRKAYGFEE